MSKINYYDYSEDDTSKNFEKFKKKKNKKKQKGKIRRPKKQSDYRKNSRKNF